MTFHLSRDFLLKSKFTTKDIALLALFAAMWATVEVNLGMVLRMFRVPFSGATLTFIGLIILFLARDSVPKRGAVLAVGFITAQLKFLFLGGIAIYPVIGIIAETFLVELSLVPNKPKQVNFLLAGASSLLWSLFHPFFTQGLLAGWGILRVYVVIIEKGAHFLAIQPQYFFLIFLIMVLVHLGLGLFAGIVGWKLSMLVYKRVYGFQVT